MKKLYGDHYKSYQVIDGWNKGNITDEMLKWCEKFSDSTCVIYENNIITYSKIGELIKKTSVGLLNRGIKPKDKVVLQLPNNVNFILCFFGLMKIGAIPIMALPAHRINEIKGMVNTAKATGYICQNRYMGFEYSQIVNELIIDDKVKNIIQINDQELIVDSLDIEEKSIFPYIDNLDIAFLSLSGGTTGMSKLIPRTHGDYLYDTEMSVRKCHFQSNDVYLAILPLPHNFILGHPGFLGTFSRGGTLLLSQYPDINEGLELIERYKATFLSMVPSMAKLMLEILKEDEYDISSLRVLQIGGAFLEESMAQELIDLKSFSLQQVFGVLNNNDYQLCGILSTGSEYSRKIAAKYHVSLYTKIDEVSSDNFDLALVVIRSGIVGGEGNKVTQQLLNKGISVIQEQPVHSEEAIENYKIALKNNIFYKVNTFYPYLPISRVFHDELHKLKLKTEIYSINGSCSMPVILPFLAQVGEILGGISPYYLDYEHCFKTSIQNYVCGTIKGIQFMFRIQSQMNSDSINKYSYTLNEFSVMTGIGNLKMTEVNGQIIWVSKPYVVEEYLRNGDENDACNINGTELLYDASGKKYSDLYNNIWPEAVNNFLALNKENIVDKKCDVVDMQYYIALCRLWKDISNCING